MQENGAPKLSEGCALKRPRLDPTSRPLENVAASATPDTPTSTWAGSIPWLRTGLETSPRVKNFARSLDQMPIGLDHTILEVHDLPESLSFYRDILGLEYKGKDGPFEGLLITPDLALDPYEE